MIEIMVRFKVFSLFIKEFLIAMCNILLRIGKSSLWFILTLIFGLLQSWIVLGKSYIIVDNNFSIEFNNLFMNGALLFFSTAIIASLTIDYFLLRRKQYSKVVTGFMFVFFPIVVLILCISLFFIIHDMTPEKIEFYTVRNIELGLLTVTGIYAIIVKFMLE